MRTLKIFGWIIGALAAAALLLGVGLWLGGSALAIWVLQHPVSAMIGRQIRVQGRLSVHWGSPTRIVVNGISLTNASWGSEPQMFSARRLEILLHPATLLWGPVRIDALSLTQSRLLLETSKDSRANWQFRLHSTVAPQRRTQFPQLDRLIVDGGELIFHNGASGATTDVVSRTLEADDPDPRGPIEIRGAGSFQKLPLTVAGTFGPLAQLRDPDQPYPVRLEGRLDRMHVAIAGTMSKPLDFAGLNLRLSLAGAKLEELAHALGVPMPDLPDFRGTGVLTGGDGSFAIRNLSMKVGQSDIAGAIAMDSRQKLHHLTARLTSSYLDLADFKGIYGGTAPERSQPPSQPAVAPADERVLPNAKIDVDKLPGIDVDLAFDADRIKPAAGLPFERVSLGLQIRNGELIVHPLRFHIAQGDVDLNLRLTPSADAPPRLVGDVDVRQVNLHSLLNGLPVPDFVKSTAGIVGGFIKIDTTGDSTRQLLGRMNGEIAIFLQRGEISKLLEELAPINVLGATGVLLKGDKPQPVDCLIAHLDVKDGDAVANPVLIELPDVQVAAEGDVNFKSEAVNLHIRPRNKSFTLLSLRTPVDVDGTLGKPQFHIEAKSLVARVGAAIGLGVAFPPAALLTLVDTGLGQNNACAATYAKLGKDKSRPASEAAAPGRPASPTSPN